MLTQSARSRQRTPPHSRADPARVEWTCLVGQQEGWDRLEENWCLPGCFTEQITLKYHISGPVEPGSLREL